MTRKELLYAIDNLSYRYSYPNISLQLDGIISFKCTDKYYNDWNSYREYTTFVVRKIDARDSSNKFMIINNNANKSIPIIPYYYNGNGCAILPYFIDTEDDLIVKITGLLLTRKYIKKYNDVFRLVWPEFYIDYICSVDINTNFTDDNLIEIARREFVNRNGDTILESKGITYGTDILIIEDKIYRHKSNALTIHYGTLLEPDILEYNTYTNNNIAMVYSQPDYTLNRDNKDRIADMINKNRIMCDFNTSKITDLTDMFKNAKPIKSLDLNAFVNSGPGVVKDDIARDLMSNSPSRIIHSSSNPKCSGGKVVISSYSGVGDPSYALTGGGLDHIYNVGDTYFDLIDKIHYECIESGNLLESKWVRVVMPIKSANDEKLKTLTAVQYAKANNDPAFLKLVETVQKEQEIVKKIKDKNNGITHVTW